MGESCGTNGGEGVFMGKPERNKPFGCSRRRCENNIEMDVQEIGWGIYWIDLAQDRENWWAFLNTVMNIGVPRIAVLSFILLH